MQKGGPLITTSCIMMAKLYTSPGRVPYSPGCPLLRISGAVHSNSETHRTTLGCFCNDKIAQTIFTRKKKLCRESTRHNLSCFLTICRRFNVGEPLRLQNLVVAVVCDLQDKAPIHHTVSGLQTSVGHPTVVEVLHTLRKKTVLDCFYPNPFNSLE